MLPLRSVQLVALAAVMGGCALRLGWPEEIEYKADEAWMFARSQAVGVTEPWPATGKVCGARTPNPGASVWVFAALARLTGASDPVSLARAVAALNCLALAGLAIFILRAVPGEEEQRAWLWALALAAASPTAIVLQRKIWAQSLLPLLGVLLLAAWWRRRSFAGAFSWALLALLAGQVHLSGLLFFAAVVAWSLLRARDSVHWRGFALGAAFGALPALPWLRALLLAPGPAGPPLWHVPTWKFWELWATDGLGFDLSFSLGPEFVELWRRPLLAGHGTWLAGLAWLGVLGIFGVFLFHLGKNLWHVRRSWRTALAAQPSDTGLLLGAAAVAYGVLLTLPDLTLHRHYLLVLFPLPQVWFAREFLRGDPLTRARHERLLLLAVALNLLVVSQLFPLLRARGGAPGGDFGVSWRAQATAPSSLRNASNSSTPAPIK